MSTEIKQIQEAYMNMYQIINEEIHPEIKQILNNVEDDPKRKLLTVTKKVKSLIASNQDTGLESDKPKKGSSRAVLFPTEHKEITVDGVKTKTPIAVKIAFPGLLDKYHKEDTLLGQDQNQVESDYIINKMYGLLSHDSATGEYHTNERGVLAPVFDTHPEHHYVEMGRVAKFTAKNFADATKTKEFPKGLKHADMYDAMMMHHRDAHGQRNYLTEAEQTHLNKVSEHPFVENLIDMMHNSGMHSGDLSPNNLGIYTHPVTGNKHPVVIDWGYSNDIDKKYQKARQASRRFD